MNNPTASLPAASRIQVLDILRGFALLGILIMNMPGFSTSFFAEADGSHLWPGKLDQLAEQVRDMLFSGKFNSMFSLLFGVGFTIQFARMQTSDPARAPSLYLRRLLVLGVIGVLHAFVVWPGDVLHVYAVLGLVSVLALRHVSDRTIVALIVVCLVYPVLSGLLRLWIITPEITAERVLLAQAFEHSNNLAFGQGSMLDAARENARIMAFFYGNALSLWSMLGWYVMMGLTMLIGLLAGRKRWFQRIPELMPQIRRATWWLLAIGLACGAAFTVIFALNRTPGPSPIKFIGGICYGLSRLALMLFYVMVIVQLSQRESWQRLLAPLALAGRMPLTNYLMQTAICVTLFQGWGFGLWGKVGPAAGMALSFVIFFAVQVPWSLWWLKRHERGPMEALWSRLTYGVSTGAASAASVKARLP